MKVSPNSMQDTRQNKNLTVLAAKIARSHISHNHVLPEDLSALIQSVHETLSKIATAPVSEPQVPPPPKPVVSVRASVKPNYLVCLVCGAEMISLKRHLRAAHDLSPAEYREMFTLKDDYPMVAPRYSERRSAMAKSFGLGKKTRGSKPTK